MPAPLVMLPVRARRALTRPAVRRLVVAALALATATCVASLAAAAGAARDRWGTTRPVAVATRDLAPGDVVDDRAVAVRDLPVAAVSRTAVSDAPVGATVRQAIPSGEPLVAERLAPHGLAGAAALVPAGHRAVAVPLGPAGRPPLAVGDLVDVVVVLAADLPAPPAAGEGATGGEGTEAGEGAGGDGGAEPPDRAAQGDPAFPLVERAAVVHVGEQAVTVAVPEGDAARVAWAVANGAVVLALAGA